MKKVTRFSLWGIGSVVFILAVSFQISEHQKRTEEERHLELQAAITEDAKALAKCASKTLNASGLRTLVVKAYWIPGFYFKKTAEVLATQGYPIGEPSDADFKEVALSNIKVKFVSQELDAILERCVRKYPYAKDNDYWPIFWTALEYEPEFAAALQEVKDENEKILAPYRRIKEARKKAEAEEQQKRMDALFKQNPAIE